MKTGTLVATVGATLGVPAMGAGLYLALRDKPHLTYRPPVTTTARAASAPAAPAPTAPPSNTSTWASDLSTVFGGVGALAQGASSLGLHF